MIYFILFFCDFVLSLLGTQREKKKDKRMFMRKKLKNEKRFDKRLSICLNEHTK